MLLVSVYFWLPFHYSLLLLSRRFATTLYDFFFFPSVFSWQVFTPVPFLTFFSCLSTLIVIVITSHHLHPSFTLALVFTRKVIFHAPRKFMELLLFFFFLLNTERVESGHRNNGFRAEGKEKKKKTRHFDWGCVAGKLWVSRGPSGEAVAGFEVSVTVLVGRNSQQYVCAFWSCLALAINSLCISASPRRFQITHLSFFFFFFSVVDGRCYLMVLCCTKNKFTNACGA